MLNTGGVTPPREQGRVAALRPRREGRTSGEEREEREREWREKTQGQLFDLAQTHDFQQELEKF